VPSHAELLLNLILKKFNLINFQKELTSKVSEIGGECENIIKNISKIIFEKKLLLKKQELSRRNKNKNKI
jgi:hypothetical protein